PYDNPEHMVLQNKMDEPISGSPRKKGPLWILYSYGLHNIKELFQDLGMLPCEVLFFRNILAKVEEQKLRLWPQHMKFDRLPISFPYRLFALLLMKLPIQMIMGLLLLTGQGGQKAYPVEILGYRNSRNLCQSGQHIPKGRDMFADTSSLYFGRPLGEHRRPNTAFVQIPLVSLKGTIAVKKVRIGASLHM